MISKEKEFIFIHNFKTGGTSIEKKLGLFETLARDVQDHRTIKDMELLTQRKRYLRNSLYSVKVGKPKSVLRNAKLFLSPELTLAEYNRYYKFTFVRNTWARVYSWYANVIKDEILRTSIGVTDPNCSFEDFLNSNMNHKTFSQLYFITDTKGNVPMDFIGRFENLQEDFNKVCERLHIEDSELPKLLVRKYGHYTDHYTERTKDLVYNLYQEEINYFGFEFEA